MDDEQQSEGSQDQQVQEAETVDWEAEARKWKDLSRKNEANAKANADKAKRFDELEEQSKTELQKAIERAERAEKRAADAEIASIRSTIAAEKGIAVGLLTGSTREEIEASADALLEWRGTQEQQVTAASSSSKDAGPRGDSVDGPKQLSRDDLKRMTPEQINQARREGRLDSLMGVK